MATRLPAVIESLDAYPASYAPEATDVSVLENSVSSVGSDYSSGQLENSSLQASAEFNPDQAPLEAAQPDAAPQAVPVNETSAEAQPAKKAAAKNEEALGHLIKAFNESKKVGNETAIADLVHRIMLVVGQAALFSAFVALSIVTVGAATPVAVWAGVGLAVSTADLGFSIANLGARAAGKDGLLYHGDSIANTIAFALRKRGMTDEAKIDKITNAVTTTTRMLLGGLTLSANQLHRPGPSNREFMDYSRMPAMQRNIAKSIIQSQKDAIETVDFNTDEQAETPAEPTPVSPQGAHEEPESDGDELLPPSPPPSAPGLSPQAEEDDTRPGTESGSNSAQSQSEQQSIDEARKHSSILNDQISRAEQKTTLNAKVAEIRQKTIEMEQKRGQQQDLSTTEAEFAKSHRVQEAETSFTGSESLTAEEMSETLSALMKSCSENVKEAAKEHPLSHSLQLDKNQPHHLSSPILGKA